MMQKMKSNLLLRNLTLKHCDLYGQPRISLLSPVTAHGRRSQRTVTGSSLSSLLQRSSLLLPLVGGFHQPLARSFHISTPRSQAKRDYYEVLGVKKTATPKEIKRLIISRPKSTIRTRIKTTHRRRKNFKKSLRLMNCWVMSRKGSSMISGARRVDRIFSSSSNSIQVRDWLIDWLIDFHLGRTRWTQIG